MFRWRVLWRIACHCCTMTVGHSRVEYLQIGETSGVSGARSTKIRKSVTVEPNQTELSVTGRSYLAIFGALELARFGKWLDICRDAIRKLEDGFTTKAIRPETWKFRLLAPGVIILPRRMALESPIEYFP